MKYPTEDEAEVTSGDPCPACGTGEMGVYNGRDKGSLRVTYIVCDTCGITGEPYTRPGSRVRRRGGSRKPKRVVLSRPKPAAKPVPPPAPPADGGGMTELPPAHASVIALHELPAATGIPLPTLGIMALAGNMPRPVVTEGAVLFDRLEIERWNLDGHAPPHAPLPPRTDAERERVGWMHRAFNERAREAVARLKAEAAGAN